MDREAALKIFQDSSALLTGHFLLSSGRHSQRYLQCALVQQYPDRLEELCREAAGLWKGTRITAVVGPAMGGIVFAYELARHVKARGIFMERVGEKLELRRGWSVSPTDAVLVAEDVVTTGKSAREVLGFLKTTGCAIVGVTSLVCRDASVDFGVPYRPLLTVEVESYAADNCPLCRRGLPVIKPGSRPTGSKGV